MNVIIPESRLDEIMFKYLDFKFKDLEQVKGKHVDIIFFNSNERYKTLGVLGWEEPDNLWISYKIINDIFLFIPLLPSEIMKSIGRYVEDRYKLEVKNTLKDKGGVYSMLYIPKI